jgi:hypothetical protein
VAPRSLKLVLALAILNASLAFQNLWPTPAIHWEGELSIEFAVLLGLLVMSSRWLGSPSAALIRGIAIVWVALTIGHYADVTAPALYGRDINLYWDLRFMPDVAAMVIRAAPFWLVIIVVAVAAMILVALYLLFRWALTLVSVATANAGQRRGMAAVATTIVALFATQWLPGIGPTLAASHVLATPVTSTYARQVRFVAAALAGSRPMAASPAMDSDLSLVQGADVYLVFIEAYGAVAFERADIAPGLTAARATLDAAIRASGRRAVSAYVDSPTFGGSSWLAHISLLSGVEVRDPETNARLMTEKRETLVTQFARHGFATVALMPGLRQRWPEGAFYGFSEIDDARRLDYRGPEFGWFAIPDQYSLAKFDAIAGNRTSRPPLFVFYPTISTHFPFSPTPPYQPDWSRMFDAHPYDGPAIVRAYARQPDWTHFAPGYVDAVSYTYNTLSGYLRRHADRDFVMILLGDHQPAAAVSGEGASWSVPVHVIASRSEILDRLVARGFRDGLTPARPALAPMNALLPVLLDAFGNRPHQ